MSDHYETTADLLDKAVDVLRTKGHCKGALTNADGAVCALGALDDVGAYDTVECLAARVVEEKLRLRDVPDIWNDEKGEVIAQWNDQPERTMQDVIDLFQETAKDIRNREDWVKEVRI